MSNPDTSPQPNTISVVVNGDRTAIAAGSTINDLLNQLQFPNRAIAVELNREVVSGQEHHRIQLKNGDQLEIVTLVGGG